MGRRRTLNISGPMRCSNFGEDFRPVGGSEQRHRNVDALQQIYDPGADCDSKSGYVGTNFSGLLVPQQRVPHAWGFDF